MSDVPVITVQQIKKYYGSIKAVDGLSFSVKRGEIFGMVGPNGAGKTTTIECVEGIRKADSGQIQVLDCDPAKDFNYLKSRVGIQLQQSSLQERIKVGEVMQLYAALYRVTKDWKPLLARMGLGGAEGQYFSKLSGGQKQRLFIALSLLHNPEIIFLDELTTGLDPQARRNMWDLVREIRDEGRTVYLTTHFMEEAEKLCDRVAIVDRGRLIALDTPQALIRQSGGGKRLLFDCPEVSIKNILDLPSVEQADKSGTWVTVYGNTDFMIAEVVQYLAGHEIPFSNLRTEQPSLEDVFLSVTGHVIEEEAVE